MSFGGKTSYHLVNRSPNVNDKSWWRHQMETFSALLAICAGNSPVSGEFLAQRSVTRSFYVFFDLRSNKRLSKQLWVWWLETHSPPLWRHSNGLKVGMDWYRLCLAEAQIGNGITCWQYKQFDWRQTHVRFPPLEYKPLTTAVCFHQRKVW